MVVPSEPTRPSYLKVDFADRLVAGQPWVTDAGERTVSLWLSTTTKTAQEVDQLIEALNTLALNPVQKGEKILLTGSRAMRVIARQIEFTESKKTGADISDPLGRYNLTLGQ